MTAMTPAQQSEFLAGLGLSPDAAAKPKKAKTAKKETKTTTTDTNPRSIPASDIVFTDDMIADFDLMTGAGFGNASRHLFDTYKSEGKNKERNGLLHRRISEFLTSQKRAKRTGGMVTGRVEVAQEVGDLAQILQQHGITAADLAALIANKS